MNAKVLIIGAGHAGGTAAAMLRLCPALMAAGQLVDAEHALPLYIRDKVAKTTQERESDKRAAISQLPP